MLKCSKIFLKRFKFQLTVRWPCLKTDMTYAIIPSVIFSVGNLIVTNYFFNTVTGHHLSGGYFINLFPKVFLWKNSSIPHRINRLKYSVQRMITNTSSYYTVKLLNIPDTLGRRNVDLYSEVSVTGGLVYTCREYYTRYIYIIYKLL